MSTPRKLVAALVGANVCSLASAAPEMHWQYENNFPFFADRQTLNDYMESTAAGIGSADDISTPTSRAVKRDLSKQVRISSAQVTGVLHDADHQIAISWQGGPSKPCVLTFKTGTRITTDSLADCSTGYLRPTVRINQPFEASLESQGKRLAEIPPTVPKDFLIIGLGDSYSSGEGNPDVPAKLTDHFDCPENTSSGGHCSLGTYRWTYYYRPEKEAEWLDRPCHRSLYSYQVQSAAAYAAKNPRTLVRFAYWSCSGAEIMDGMLMPQQRVPGGGNEPMSQLVAATQALCPRSKNTFSFDTRGAQGTEHDRRNDPSSMRVNLESCDDTGVRKPDIIVFSIGGNDVNFAPVVINSITPNAGNLLYKFALKSSVTSVSPEIATKSISSGWLKRRYELLNEALSMTIAAPTTRILQLEYPNPMRFADSQEPCRTKADLGTDSLSVIFNATFRKSFNIQTSESEKVDRLLVTPLQAAIKTNSKFGWEIVDQHMDSWLKHGFCSPQDAPERATENAFPRYNGKRHSWDAKHPTPTAWQPYAKVSRWIRMPNDAYLTQYTALQPLHIGFDQYVPYSESLLGTAHPNAYGHSAFAKATLSAIENGSASTAIGLNK